MSPNRLPLLVDDEFGKASGLMYFLLIIAMIKPTVNINPPVSFKKANQGVSNSGKYSINQP